MKKISCIFWASLSLLLAMTACNKDTVTDSPAAHLEMAVDTLRFDTVFTGAGTVTRQFVIRNPNTAAIVIDHISVNAQSPFEINVNGRAGPEVNDLRVNGGDSIYVFVRAHIDPTQTQAAFLLNDSIQVQYNTQRSQVYLQAYGRNARYVAGGIITGNTTWTSERAIILTGAIVVEESATLTIEPGTEIFAAPQAPVIINGRLLANGEADARITFKGSRLDAPYDEIPGTWPGIVINGQSTGNKLQFVSILNGYKGLTVIGNSSTASPQVELEGCILHNHYDAALHGINASIRAKNSQLTQSGNNGAPGTEGHTVLLQGGNYNFEHCTLASFASFYINHKQVTLALANNYAGTPLPLDARFYNTIIYGSGSLQEDEILLQKSTAANWNVEFDHVLYRQSSPLNEVVIANSMANIDPVFDSISPARNHFRFMLRAGSPAIDAGGPTALTADLPGNPRISGIRPDLGAFEFRQ